jgi:8-oxo-dGTP pyrophosphatase MutT (NUDIX family)
MNQVATPIVTDGRSPRFPVSIKGVVFVENRVVLLQNERDEWELPGGKLEPGEDPAACVVREVMEELALDVALGPILDSWLYDIRGQVEVLIVTYGCRCDAPGDIVISHEHKAVGLFAVDEIDGLSMPEGYRRSIRAWAALRGDHPSP